MILLDKRLRIAGIVAAIAASVIILNSPSQPLPLPAPNVSNSGSDSVEIIATNLEKPRSITAFGDRIFLTEKDGRIRVVENGTLLGDPLATFRVADAFNGGLLGITVHPNFTDNHYLYVYYTYSEKGVLWNKILRIVEYQNRLKDAVTILDKIPGSKFSNGGVIKFGPDGKLYVGTGSVSDDVDISQDPNSLAGKILRINDDGTIPHDNPFPNSPVYAMGFRNPQGMTWDDNQNLIVSDVGPTKNDEINIVSAGDNFGWPHQECSGDERFQDSTICYDPAIEPGGILFYSGNNLPFDKKLLVASLRATALFELDLSKGLSSQKSVLGGLGRIRDVYEDQNGMLYIITSNTDGKGFPDSQDDKLVRIVK